MKCRCSSHDIYPRHSLETHDGTRKHAFSPDWRSWWNRFDASLVFLSVLSDLVFGVFVNSVNPSVFRIFRIARLAKLARSIRALRLVRMNQATAEMVETVNMVGLFSERSLQQFLYRGHLVRLRLR